MEETNLFRAIDLMFCSPSPALTMEFQGGEPTLVPDLIRKAIEYAEERNREQKRHMTYVICTNCVDLTNDLLDICKQYDVVISTSLDGPQFLHDRIEAKQTATIGLLRGSRKPAPPWAKITFPH